MVFRLIRFSPAHLVAHGVFRLILELEEETIVTTDACLRLLFRATERLVESKALELLAGYFAYRLYD